MWRYSVFPPRVNSGGVNLAITDGVISRVLAAKKSWNVEIVNFATFDALPADVQKTTKN